MNIKQTSGQIIEAGEFGCYLNDLEPGDVLFIDQIHRLPTAVEEVLYRVLWKILSLIGSGILVVVSILIFHRYPHRCHHACRAVVNLESSLCYHRAHGVL